ncbi:DeoR/GlpR transcriptional regulator [Aerococcus agrisoli]|uniref:Lactose phosphotransferase system repressor n=1 Tax=Aerococcus agrisoli TaxID=2487350 RepID=A0A3N4GDB2_9LACT|nr:DeoR/GlpR family DNA-binding transcription regulator [Aerococcus agrisoli]RPA59347.1 DeoR/GlpR transcriptional regulator [Aerococcus agrisoli]
MLKKKRHEFILEALQKNGTVSVTDIVEKLNVSDMTVRRDLTELEDDGALKRVHGGAISQDKYPKKELSHDDKKVINIHEKTRIALKAIDLINEDDIIFMGPGTTMEIMAQNLDQINCQIYTNCLPVFQTLIEKDIEVYLLGGRIKRNTQAFNGYLTLSVLENLKFHKAFFSANAVNDNSVMTATIEEGKTQARALDNSTEKYLLLDSSKVGKEDFFTYYQLDEVTSVIINDDVEHQYQEIVKHTNTLLVE